MCLFHLEANPFYLCKLDVRDIDDKPAFRQKGVRSQPRTKKDESAISH